MVIATINEKMSAIADAIRDKTDTTDKLSLDGMAQAIPEVYGQGKQTQYDEFWDKFQSKGNRRYYQYAFYGEGWGDTIYNPKYPIITNNANYVFASSSITDTKVTIDVSGATSSSSYTFNASKIKTIRKLIVSENILFTGYFGNCSSLENLVVEGVMGNNIDFKSCPLSKNSIMGKLITAEEYEVLSDAVKNNNVFYFDGNYYYGGVVSALSKTTTGKTLTLKKSAVNNAFGIDVDDETTYPDGTEFYNLRHSKDNWTFSYV